MGSTNQDMVDAKKNGTTRGSGKSSPYKPNTGGRVTNWGDVDENVLSQCMDAITSNGDAALIGRSLDGGVLVLTVCAGAERIKFYAREGLEMTAHLQGIVNELGKKNLPS